MLNRADASDQGIRGHARTFPTCFGSTPAEAWILEREQGSNPRHYPNEASYRENSYCITSLHLHWSDKMTNSCSNPFIISDDDKVKFAAGVCRGVGKVLASNINSHQALCVGGSSSLVSASHMSRSDSLAKSRLSVEQRKTLCLMAEPMKIDNERCGVHSPSPPMSIARKPVILIPVQQV